MKLSFNEVHRRANALANALLDLGLKDGERVGVWLPNRWEWVVTQFACAKAGFILVNVNPAYRSSELHYAAKLVGLRALIMQASLKTSDYHKILSEAGNIPSLLHVIEVGYDVHEKCISFNKLIFEGSSHSDSQLKSKKISCYDAVNIQFTSGTTGHPKGTVLSHHNILNNGYHFGVRLGMKDSDKVLLPVPLYHCFGCVCGVLAALVLDATIVLPSESFNAEACLHSIDLYGVTIMYGVPTMHLEVELFHQRNPKFHNVQSLIGGAMGGSPCPPDLMKKMIKLGMKDMVCAYGMTETSPVSFSTCSEDSLENQCNTVGTVLDHVEVKIVDQQSGKTLKIGEVGELCTRGYSVMTGYWNQEDKTKEAITEDGFMKTGDLASIDSHGFCRIVGRSKDMIIRGGENIFPAEVENFLLKMPGVNDVAIIGVPDQRFGEEVCAWIRPKHDDLTVEQVKKFCKNKIAHYKVPRYVFNVKEFPLTVTGKVRKQDMRTKTVEWLKNKPKSKL